MYEFKDDHGHHEREHNHIGHTHDEGCTCNECASGLIVKIMIHEDAVSGSFCVKTSLSEHAVNNILSENMIKLAKWVKENHGIIGHIKAVVTGGSGAKMFSITKDEVNNNNNGANLNAPFEVLFTAIVFNIKIEEIERKLIKIYNKFILNLS